eukprot:3955087-Amphidinium_carterae.1
MDAVEPGFAFLTHTHITTLLKLHTSPHLVLHKVMHKALKMSVFCNLYDRPPKKHPQMRATLEQATACTKATTNMQTSSWTTHFQAAPITLLQIKATVGFADSSVKTSSLVANAAHHIRLDASFSWKPAW